MVLSMVGEICVDSGRNLLIGVFGKKVGLGMIFDLG